MRRAHEKSHSTALPLNKKEYWLDGLEETLESVCLGLNLRSADP